MREPRWRRSARRSTTLVWVDTNPGRERPCADARPGWLRAAPRFGSSRRSETFTNETGDKRRGERPRGDHGIPRLGPPARSPARAVTRPADRARGGIRRPARHRSPPPTVTGGQARPRPRAGAGESRGVTMTRALETVALLTAAAWAEASRARSRSASMAARTPGLPAVQDEQPGTANEHVRKQSTGTR